MCVCVVPSGSAAANDRAIVPPSSSPHIQPPSSLSLTAAPLSQLRKHLRQTLRRLKSTVVAGEALAAHQAAAAAEGGEVIGDLGTLTAGGVRAASAAISADIVRGAAPRARERKLRYSFNAPLRAARLADDLEDITDDEEECRLGVVNVGADGGEYDRPVEGPTMEAMGEGAEMSGVVKSSGRALPKNMDHITEADFRDGCGGMFASDPALAPADGASKKKALKRGKHRQAISATTPGDYSGSGRGAAGARAAYKFWGDAKR